MATCFVMQPFDKGNFDRRFEEILKPAIEEAGLEAYRVDEDPEVSIPIESIEAGIVAARVCLADITMDNPNVWFELGYAISAGKEVVLICSDERTTKFPFDVQHRSIIPYSGGSPSAFAKLRQDVTAKIKAYLSKKVNLEELAATPKVAAQAGLTPHELMAVAVITGNLKDAETSHVDAWRIKTDMEASGFNATAAIVALRMLSQKKLLEASEYQGRDEDLYTGYSPTAAGWDWIIANHDKLNLKQPPPRKSRGAAPSFDDMDDDIPF